MKLYTKTGDGGETGLYGADRVRKTHPRVEAYGTVDELNSALGLVRAFLGAAFSGAASPGAASPESVPPDLDRDLDYLQTALFDVGADLATRSGSRYEAKLSRLDEQDVQTLEAMIDRYQAEVPPLSAFVHPGGTVAAAQLQVARAVARRAEREVIRLAEVEECSPQVQVYLNRLSDLLFVMARAVNARAGVSEEQWRVGARR